MSLSLTSPDLAIWASWSLASLKWFLFNWTILLRASPYKKKQKIVDKKQSNMNYQYIKRIQNSTTWYTNWRQKVMSTHHFFDSHLLCSWFASNNLGFNNASWLIVSRSLTAVKINFNINMERLQIFVRRKLMMMNTWDCAIFQIQNFIFLLHNFKSCLATFK